MLITRIAELYDVGGFDHFAEWRMVLVDLRNHGNSAGVQSLEPPHDLDNAAADLANLVKSQGWDWPDVVIGHSLGGKVALQFAQSGARGDYGDSIELPKQVLICYSLVVTASNGNILTFLIWFRYLSTWLLS